MPDSKNMKWVDRFGTDSEADSKLHDAVVENAPLAANDSDGWQQYRRWVSRAPAPTGRHAGVDPSVYTWKGYREWSDKVKRNWIKDPDSD
jgi:hypothetical protein